VNIGLVLLNKNEIEAIPYILPKLNVDMFTKVFAIDGNSTDGSDKLISDTGIEVLKQKSSGRGAAFKMAFDHVRNSNIEALVFMSLDGNEDPLDLAKFKFYLDSGYDLVIASRMKHDSVNEEDDQLLRFRKWGNLFFMYLAFVAFGRTQTRISDPINGYRGLTLKAWASINPRSDSFDIEYEISVLAYKNRLKYVEFPTIEYPRIGGRSNATAFYTSKILLKVLIRELFDRSE
jgi:Glycosyl transferase family 2